MALSQQYLDQLLALLPPGAAWPRHMEALLSDLLQAFADEFARLHIRAEGLLSERSPMLASELLDEWEADLGLPDPCGIDVTDTDSRRAAVVARLVSVGGQTPAFYLQVLAAFGVQASITEFLPHSVDDDVDAALCGEDWTFAWQLHLPSTVVREFAVIDGVDEALAAWGDPPVECLIRRLAPEHTIVLFSYQ